MPLLPWISEGSASSNQTISVPVYTASSSAPQVYVTSYIVGNPNAVGDVQTGAIAPAVAIDQTVSATTATASALTGVSAPPVDFTIPGVVAIGAATSGAIAPSPDITIPGVIAIADATGAAVAPPPDITIPGVVAIADATAAAVAPPPDISIPGVVGVADVQTGVVAPGISVAAGGLTVPTATAAASAPYVYTTNYIAGNPNATAAFVGDTPGVIVTVTAENAVAHFTPPSTLAFKPSVSATTVTAASAAVTPPLDRTILGVTASATAAASPTPVVAGLATLTVPTVTVNSTIPGLIIKRANPQSILAPTATAAITSGAIAPTVTPGTSVRSVPTITAAWAGTPLPDLSGDTQPRTIAVPVITPPGGFAVRTVLTQAFGTLQQPSKRPRVDLPEPKEIPDFKGLIESYNPTPCTEQDHVDNASTLIEILNEITNFFNECCETTCGEVGDQTLIKPCCSYLGVVVGKGKNAWWPGLKAYGVHLYTLDGKYAGFLKNALSWTTCDIKAGMMVAADTDQNCLVRLTPDLCETVIQCCSSTSLDPSSSSSVVSSSVSSGAICACVDAPASVTATINNFQIGLNGNSSPDWWCTNVRTIGMTKTNDNNWAGALSLDLSPIQTEDITLDMRCQETPSPNVVVQYNATGEGAVTDLGQTPSNFGVAYGAAGSNCGPNALVCSYEGNPVFMLGAGSTGPLARPGQPMLVTELGDRKRDVTASTTWPYDCHLQPFSNNLFCYPLWEIQLVGGGDTYTLQQLVNRGHDPLTGDAVQTVGGSAYYYKNWGGGDIQDYYAPHGEKLFDFMDPISGTEPPRSNVPYRRWLISASFQKSAALGNKYIISIIQQDTDAAGGRQTIFQPTTPQGTWSGSCDGDSINVDIHKWVNGIDQGYAGTVTVTLAPIS